MSSLRLQLYPLLVSPQPLHSHRSQVWLALPLWCPDCDPDRGWEKAPYPHPPASWFKHSRVTREGGDEAWKLLRILCCPLPGWWPDFPTFSVGPGWPAQLLELTGHMDLNLASTQEKPGLSKGVPGRPQPGAACQESSSQRALACAPCSRML